MSKVFIDSPDIMSASVDQPISEDLKTNDSPAEVAEETPAATEGEPTGEDTPTDGAEPEGQEVDENGEPVSTTGEDDATAPGAKPRQGVQKRIDELTRQRYETQRDRDYWRDLAMRGGAPKPAAGAAPAAAIDMSKMPKPPTLAEFAYDEKKFNEALIGYNDKLFREAIPAAVAGEIAKSQHGAQQQRALQEMQGIADAFGTREAEAVTRYADYEEVAHNPDLNVTPNMAVAIQLSEKGPDIAYYLGSHPAEAAKICALSPIAQATAIGRLEARFLRSGPKKPTQSPAPMKPVGSRGVVTKDPSKMSTAEYRAYREKQTK